VADDIAAIVYEVSSATGPLKQGEIVSDIIEPRAEALPVDPGEPIAFDLVTHPFLVVVTQACDLERDFADRLRQILWNLLTNAVKFTPKGGRVEIELRCTDTSASVVVSDTGQGIGQDFLRHVFERFRQADSTASRRHGGLGLGLAIVRHLTEAHGGSVSAESAGEGLGATFTVQLPVREVRARERADQNGEPRGTALAGLRVLIVDDEPDTRDVLRVMLEVQGAGVTVASSAGEALDLLRRQPTDVLLADIGMPEQDGYALIEAVRALPTPEAVIPAVAVTAYVSSRDRVRAFKAGYGWHVAKPVDPDQLVAVVSAAARNHPSSAQPS
jgi:CheY-like chemotaxis protein